MMWIANLKENINKMALDVHDDDYDDEEDEFEIHGTRGNGIDSSRSPPFSDRRRSSSLGIARSLSASQSPVTNGVSSPHDSEIERHRAEIKRLQESESEIKALSVNYAALLKEKEDHISRLNKENGSLKKNLSETNVMLSSLKSESSKTSTSIPSPVKGSTDQSPNRQHRLSTPIKNRYLGNHTQNGNLSKQDELSNGTRDGIQPDIIQSKIDAKHSSSSLKEKELTDMLEEKNRSIAALQSTHELQMKQLKVEFEKERENLANMQIKLQEEHKLNATFQEELQLLKMDNSRKSMQMSKIEKELNEKNSEVKRLQIELNSRKDKGADATTESLERDNLTLEEENGILKAHPSGSFIGKEEMEISLQKLENDLKVACQERDKALHELKRLKQHLLEKESEESEKMDEDIQIIEDLRRNNEYQRVQILQLENALKQAIAKQEDVKMINHNELQKSKEIISDLNKKIGSCMSTIDAKNVEILNLQTALGQYYAEIEAKERLESNLSLVREESAKLSEMLKDEKQHVEILKKEREELLAKLSQTEKTFGEGKNRVNKLEEDNAKLRRALEQSMTRINRMSVDSDFFVDRRIVIKLLVTYFQRNHSKDVLDLMVRMLGFTDEDKQRIGGAQQGAGKGVVRGMLGLPGRLVGGIMGGGGGSADGHANNASSDNQSFTDLWVDFLLKETEARERREMAESTDGDSKENPHEISSNLKSPNTHSIRGNYTHSEISDSEMSNIPLSNNARISRLLPKY